MRHRWGEEGEKKGGAGGREAGGELGLQFAEFRRGRGVGVSCSPQETAGTNWVLKSELKGAVTAPALHHLVRQA